MCCLLLRDSVLLLSFTAVAKFLIESGADVNIQGNNGCRAFDIGSIIGEHYHTGPLFLNLWIFMYLNVKS